MRVSEDSRGKFSNGGRDLDGRFGGFRDGGIDDLGHVKRQLQ